MPSSTFNPMTKVLKPAAIANELQVSAWLNTPSPISIAQLRGKVIVIHAFQMLCPGCVSHGIPQAKAIHQHYQHDDLQVIGLHSVFEHHHAMTPDALAAFVHEYKLNFPIAIDQADDSGPIPKTMASYQMQGTPTLIIIDKQGSVRANFFGRPNDLQVGDLVGRLLAEEDRLRNKCDDDVCAL